jgi:helicase
VDPHDRLKSDHVSACGDSEPVRCSCMLRGLFVGVDRYADPGAQWLTSACRDARALQALFLDNLGGDADLLLDEQATHSAIADAFADLSHATVEDVVVIAFSGHGTPSHELAPHDAERRRPADTMISAEQLSRWVSAIPATNLLLVLDCCFSGGAGAKVMPTDRIPRSPGSGLEAIERIAGTGRIVLTAASANQEAFESRERGHGLLSLHLLAGLQGAPEIVSGGKVQIYRLLEYVTRRVADEARGKGRSQTPTMMGSVQGELAWPVFEPGPRYRLAFPGTEAAPATADLQSLCAFGFPVALVGAWAGEVSSLNQLQLDAINVFGVLKGDNLVVSAPTSSGKTMVGELAALHGALRRKRAIFLMPTKALVYDKKRQFDRVYGLFGVVTLEATGETEDIGPLLRGRFDIALLTYEKFLAIAVTHPHVLDQASVVVVDEVQMIADESRGRNLEFLMTLLVMRMRRAEAPQVIALSAVIGDTNGLEGWLSARLLRRMDRPVPLDEGLLLGDGRFRCIDGVTGEERVSGPVMRRNMMVDSSQDWVIPLVRKLVGEGKRVIVFREETGEARGCAGYLAANLGLPAARDALAELPPGDPSRASAALRECLEGGVAFHISHLSPGERRVVEDHFRKPQGTLRVIAATTTLAMGVNTPAEAVVIVGLEHPGRKPYSVADYKNLAGRAGRLGYADHGTSYLLATSLRDEDDLWRRYVMAAAEDVRSHFMDADARTMIVRIVAASRRSSRAGAGMTADQVVEFLEASFGAFQEARSSGGAWRWERGHLQRNLASLTSAGLLEADEEGRYSLTPLGELCGETGVEVASVLRVASCLRMIPALRVTDPELLALAQITDEADGVRMPFNKKSVKPHHVEPVTWFGELANQGISQATLSAFRFALTEPGQDVMRAKRAVACLLYVQGSDMMRIEEVLTRFSGAKDGIAGPARQAAARTCDVLPMVARAAMLIHAGLDLGERLERLLVRLDLGVAASVADIAGRARSALDRGDYQRLVAKGIVEPEVIAGTADDVLLAILYSPDKVAVLRRAAEDVAEARARRGREISPVLEAYVG